MKPKIGSIILWIGKWIWIVYKVEEDFSYGRKSMKYWARDSHGKKGLFHEYVFDVGSARVICE